MLYLVSKCFACDELYSIRIGINDQDYIGWVYTAYTLPKHYWPLRFLTLVQEQQLGSGSCDIIVKWLLTVVYLWVKGLEITLKPI